MKFAKIALFGLVAMVVLYQVADAQLFRRNIQRTRVATVQSCPGGVCTTTQSQTVRARLVPAPAMTLPAAFLPQSQPTPAPAKPVSSDCTFGLSEVAAIEPVTIPDFVLAQVDEPVVTARDSFRSALAKAINRERKAGKINLRDAVKLRVAMLSPAFVERAHDLAVAQVAFSGVSDAAVPMSEDGVVQVDGINWDGLSKFLETIIPLLITLLRAFGV